MSESQALHYGRVSHYVIRYSHNITLTDTIYFMALDLAQDIENRPYFISGKSSRGLAASCIWIASILAGERITQIRVATAKCGETCGIGVPTLSKLYRGIVKELRLVDDTSSNLELRYGLREGATHE